VTPDSTTTQPTTRNPGELDEKGMAELRKVFPAAIARIEAAARQQGRDERITVEQMQRALDLAGFYDPRLHPGYASSLLAALAAPPPEEPDWNSRLTEELDRIEATYPAAPPPEEPGE
jgi:hypothetical protein